MKLAAAGGNAMPKALISQATYVMCFSGCSTFMSLEGIEEILTEGL
jgi:hypothetical protein